MFVSFPLLFMLFISEGDISLSVAFFVGFVDLGHNNSQTLMSLFSYNSISLYI